jgi:hypothetical protein
LAPEIVTWGQCRWFSGKRNLRPGGSADTRAFIGTDPERGIDLLQQQQLASERMSTIPGGAFRDPVRTLRGTRTKAELAAPIPRGTASAFDWIGSGKKVQRPTWRLGKIQGYPLPIRFEPTQATRLCSPARPASAAKLQTEPPSPRGNLFDGKPTPGLRSSVRHSRANPSRNRQPTSNDRSWVCPVITSWICARQRPFGSLPASGMRSV